MSGKKIKADSVDELMEIVRAIQNGEEPDEALRRKEKERAPVPETEEPEDDFPDDEFDRILAEEEELDIRPAMKRISSGAGKILGGLKRLGSKGAGTRKRAAVGTSEADSEVEENAERDAERPEAGGTNAERDAGSPEAGGTNAERDAGSPEAGGTNAERDAGSPEAGETSGKRDVERPEAAGTDVRGKEPVNKKRDYFSDIRKSLAGKGIRRRELIMIGMGLILVVLIILLIINGISASHSEKVKSRNVTADQGLTVTVEQQPEQWCSSYPVVLRFRAQGRTVTKVTIDGEDYVPDENNLIVVMASENLLEAAAITEQGTLNARIEIPMIDSQPPVVSVSRNQDKIQVTAADARSDVIKIYYAAVHDTDYMRLPKYQLYDGPLTFEADTIYYFYAEDKAGNRSSPLVTSTEAAGSMTIDKEELSLFPEETGYLSVEAVPENGLLNNLRFESADPEVVTVSVTGAVTAVGEGRTLVKASADGVEEVSCEVTVSNTRTVTISAIGDCTLGTDESFNTTTNFDAFDTVNGHSYFFENVRSVLQDDDATFANLEGPLTTAETKTTIEQFAFKGDPAYTEILRSGSVDVVTLANNHINDYGTQGLEDTKSYLKEAGIDYCINDEIAIKDVNGIKTAFIGIYELNEGIECESRVRETIANAKEQGAQLVIVAFHWGSERSNQPDEIQQSLAHTAVDCGADLVVGHHPHVLQGIEKYNGKYIVYSLGNFCFGGNSAPSDLDTIIFRQTFSVTRDEVLKDDQITIIPCSISSAEGYNNYQPTPAADSEAERIIGRLNEYSSQFGQKFTTSGTVDGQESQAQENQVQENQVQENQVQENQSQEGQL